MSTMLIFAGLYFVVSLGIGIPFLLISQKMQKEYRQKVAVCNCPATGYIVRHNREIWRGTDSRTSVSYRAIAKFEHGGKEFEVADVIHRNPPRPKIGTPVHVLFNAENPEIAIVKEFNVEGSAKLFGYIGIGMLIFGGMVETFCVFAILLDYLPLL